MYNSLVYLLFLFEHFLCYDDRQFHEIRCISLVLSCFLSLLYTTRKQAFGTS